MQINTGISSTLFSAKNWINIKYTKLIEKACYIIFFIVVHVVLQLFLFVSTFAIATTTTKTSKRLYPGKFCFLFEKEETIELSPFGIQT